MKNRILTIGSVIVVVVTLMMISSASAIIMTQNQSLTNEKKLHIDSNIKITKRYEQKLTDAYNNIDDEDFKILLGNIILLVNTKKVVNSDDIKEIISDNSLAISAVHFARSIYTIYDDNWYGFSPGGCGFHAIRLLYFGSPFYWIANTGNWPGIPIKVQVGSDTYNYNHRGLVVSYIGYGTNVWTFDMNNGYRSRFNMGGFGFLIFVS